MTKNTRLSIAGAAVALIAVLLVQNSQRADLTFIAWEVRLPLFLVVLLAAGLGFAVGRLIRRRR